MGFRTLSERHATKEPQVLVEGVPQWLRTSIVKIVMLAVTRGPEASFETEAVRRLERLTQTSNLMSPPPGTSGFAAEWNLERNLLNLDQWLLLKIFDEVLRLLPVFHPTANQVLTEAGSAYEARLIKIDGKEVGALERRVSPDLQEAVSRIERIPRVGEEILAARSVIFGLQPNPTIGLQHCVKAVETAGLPVVEPANSKGTLGTLAATLKANPGRFVIGMRGATVATLEGMCRSLWDTERPHRHGTAEAHAPVPPTQQEAEAGFALCLLLVEWFTKGMVKRV